MRLALRASVAMSMLPIAACRAPDNLNEFRNLNANHETVYAAGLSSSCESGLIAGIWIERSFSAYENPIKLSSGNSVAAVFGLTKKDSDFYAAGMIAGFPVTWKNGSFVARKFPVSAPPVGVVTAVTSRGENVYFAGYYSPIGSQNTTGIYWKNDEIQFETPDNVNARINTITVEGDDVFLGGCYASSTSDCAAVYWKNGVFVELKGLDPSKSSEVTNMIISDGVVLSVGMATNSDNVKMPVLWKNDELIELPVIDRAKGGKAAAIAVDGQDIYVVGEATISTDLEVGGFWKDGVFSLLPTLSPNGSSSASSIVIHNGVTYIGGSNSAIMAYDAVGSLKQKIAASSRIAGYWRNGVFMPLSPACRSFPAVSEVKTILLQ